MYRFMIGFFVSVYVRMGGVAFVSLLISLADMFDVLKCSHILLNYLKYTWYAVIIRLIH